MGTFLLLLFIFFFVIPLVRVAYTVYTMRRKMRDAMHQMYDTQTRGRGDAPRPRKAGWSTPQAFRKKIGKDVGEYVKFEEVTVASAEDTATADSRKADNGRYNVESQVSDADWEDIK